MAEKTPERAVRAARRIPVVRWLARGGFAVNGTVHLVVGSLIVLLAAGNRVDAEPTGAFSGLATTPVGLVALWAATVSLATLGCWLLAGALVLHRPSSRQRVLRFVTEAGRGVAYLALAALAFAFTQGGPEADAEATTFTARLLAQPGGIVVILAVGLALLAAGTGFAMIGLRRTFTRNFDAGTGRAEALMVALGAGGYVAKGIAFGIIGSLFVAAAVTTDPGTAQGLDGALRSLLDLPFGPLLVGAVGGGFICYGIYSMALTRVARL